VCKAGTFKIGGVALESSEERLLVPKRAVIGLRRVANAQEADIPVHIAKHDSHLFSCVRRARDLAELYMTPQMNADECRQYQVFMRLCFLNMRNYL
jgi:hypothetical protein